MQVNTAMQLVILFEAKCFNTTTTALLHGGTTINVCNPWNMCSFSVCADGTLVTLPPSELEQECATS